jgi:predicted AAA+ superfamily ATPase
VTAVIEKDVVLSAGIHKVREFLRTARLLAGRTAQLLVASNIAQDAGVKQPTVQEWISVLERMQILATVEPYSSSLSHRLLRTPKVYFLDVGLATRLQGWSEAAPLLVSPQVGGLFETLVYSEIRKIAAAHGRDWQINYLRNKEKDEVDFFLHGANATRLALEVKWAREEAAHWQAPARLLSLLDDAPQCVVSFLGGRSSHAHVQHVSLAELGSYLLSRLD